MGSLSPQQIRDWLDASCRQQGVSVSVTDPVVLDRVAVLLTGRAARRDPAGVAPPDARSQSPHGLDTGRVEPASPPAGVDDSVVEDGLDDGASPVEVEVRPLAS